MESDVGGREREILERAVRTIAGQAAKTDAIVDEALAAGLDGSDPITVHVKMLRQELLDVKRDLERELGELVLACSKCGRTVHWVAGDPQNRFPYAPFAVVGPIVVS
jgi:hypothetical protein